LSPENDKKFTQRLKATPKVTVTLVRKPKQERAWKGLGLKTLDDEGKITLAVTLDTLDTGLHPQIIWKDSSSTRLGESSRPVSDVSPVSESKPVFYAKDIPAGEKCDCGKFAVTKEILTPTGDTLKRCQECFEDLHAKFPGADWKQGYEELPDYEEREGEEA
jgi:hypothetical protein